MGFNTPGVSENTICESSVLIMPMMRWRVVCALKVAIEMRSPMRRFIRVDFPTLGFPTIFTKPALCIGEKRVEVEEVVAINAMNKK